MKKACFIALEGIDGAGTTSQLHLLAEHLRAHNEKVHITQEPSNNPLGLMLRQILTGEFLDRAQKRVDFDEETVALLFAADRVDHYKREIAPALESGSHVISDRYLGSSYAYQGALCGLDWVKAINARAPQPDLTLYFEVSPETAAMRRAQRAQAQERFELNDIQKAVAKSYQSLPQQLEHVVTIDAAQTLPEVTKACLKAITALLEID